MRKVFLIILSTILATPLAYADSGLKNVKSSYTVAVTADRLEAALNDFAKAATAE